jgi:hypothetical protein
MTDPVEVIAPVTGIGDLAREVIKVLSGSCPKTGLVISPRPVDHR